MDAMLDQVSGRPLATAQPRAGGAFTRVRRWFHRHEERLLPLISALVVALAWEVSADVGLLNPMFFAPPSAIILAGFNELQTALFWNDVRTSVAEFISGYAIALVAGLTFGFVMGWYRRFAYFFEPWVNALNATPSLALMPLVLIWFGLGGTSKVAIVFVTTFVTVVVNIYTGAHTVDRRLARVAASYGATRRHLLRTVVLPSVAPFAFAAARIGVGRAVSGVVVGEFFSADSGMAFRIFQDAQLLRTADVLFGALAITFLALGVFKMVGLAERRTLRWRSVAAGTSRLVQVQDA
jgi:ABC-type nitrate/sulfonate/bicarbonate transport system permease component